MGVTSEIFNSILSALHLLEQTELLYKYNRAFVSG